MEKNRKEQDLKERARRLEKEKQKKAAEEKKKLDEMRAQEENAQMNRLVKNFLNKLGLIVCIGRKIRCYDYYIEEQ